MIYIYIFRCALYNLNGWSFIVFVSFIEKKKENKTNCSNRFNLNFFVFVNLRIWKNQNKQLYVVPFENEMRSQSTKIKTAIPSEDEMRSSLTNF